MTALLITVLAGLLLLLALGRWARTLPLARAWDPNSHDKMTLYALDLLARQANPTLLGWVLARSRGPGSASFFKHAIESQVRRGSVEEDMNSFLLERIFFTGFSLGPCQILKGGTDTLEGANGGYHFLNPQKTGAVQGLSDPPFFAWLIGKWGSGCSAPMPSAIDRAFSSRDAVEDTGWSGYVTSTKPWHLDTELRNYSVGDAAYYFQWGYSHLGFYAIGRICHLLQDMTVPAHVRNDAHPGGMFQDIGYDPSDPLEVYADAKDVPVGGFTGDSHKWAFDPFRVYPSEGQEIYDAAHPHWEAHWPRYPAPQQRLFMNLANLTYPHHYSYNTIPGNGNSHDPENPESRPLVRAGKIDWDKCRPSTDALFELFLLFLQEAQVIFPAPSSPPDQSPQSRAAFAQAQAQAETVAALAAQINTVTFRETKNGEAWAYRSVIGICPKYHFTAAALKEMLNLVDRLYPPIKAQRDGFQQITSPYALQSVPLSRIEAVGGFANRYERLALDLLKKTAENPPAVPGVGSDDDPATGEIMRQWLEAHPSPQDLFTAFNVITPSVKAVLLIPDKTLNGPCCLTEELIDKQWKTTQPTGVAFTAILLASWFERQFTGERAALDVWLNKDPGDSQARPELSPIAGPAPGDQVFKAVKTATIGLASRMPVPMEMAMEIQVVADEEFTDKEVLEKGLELDLSWGRLRPTDLVSVAKVEEFPTEMSAETIRLDPVGQSGPEHYLIRDLKAYVAKDQAASLAWVRQDLASVSLGGKEAGGGDGDVKQTVPLAEAEPFNLPVLFKLPLPKGIWSPGLTDMGGITRDLEQNPLFFPSVEVSKDDQLKNRAIAAAFLRLVPRIKGEAKILDAPPPGGGPGGQGGQP